MLPNPSLMRDRATFSAKTQAVSSDYGEVSDTFTTSAPVWAHLRDMSQTRSVEHGRYAYPVTHRLTVYKTSQARAGSRVMVVPGGSIVGRTFEILGVDDRDPFRAFLDLREVPA